MLNFLPYLSTAFIMFLSEAVYMSEAVRNFNWAVREKQGKEKWRAILMEVTVEDMNKDYKWQGGEKIS